MRDFQLPRRSAAVAANAMAATSHPLATLAAVEQLRAGGNAVDAAISAVAVLAMAEPHMTGLGGDCFVIYAKKGGIPIALNGSGRAPMKAAAEWYAERGVGVIAPHSPHAVTVPGAVDAWCRFHADHGTREMGALLAPAIALAEEGVALTPRVASDFADNGLAAFWDEDARRVFAPHGRVLRLGERLGNPALAETMRRIARDGRSGFYDGPVVADIVAKLNALGGLHTLEDFSLQRAEYVAPIIAPYRGHEVLECPPNGQGIAALMILRVLAGFDLANAGETDRIHLLAEATKAAYAARDTFVGDPAFADIPVERLNSDVWADKTRAAIRMDRAGPFGAATLENHTVYLTVVDRDGNAISFINSIFHEFGSGIMAPGSGVLLHSRGSMFRTSPRGHPNVIAPGKRPLHTIIPGMLMAGAEARMPFGVMGGNYQATGHAHLLMQIIDRGLDPQAALETPRSFAFDGILGLERTIAPAIAQDLTARGHRVAFAERPFGGGQAIWIDERGFLVGGSDPRKDGMALGY